MRKFYQLEIMETGRASPGTDPDESRMFNCIKEEFKSLEEAERFLKHRYGENYRRGNRVYQDKKDGTTEEVGFIRSFWNKDISHNSKSWWQTDWIFIYEIERKPVLLKGEKE